MTKRKTKWMLMFCCLICMVFFSGPVKVKAAKTSEVPYPEVVRIGSKRYMTLEKAVKAVKKGQTIVYRKGDCYEQAVVLEKDTSYTIDFKNFQTFSMKDALHGLIIVKKGTVTVKNGNGTSFIVEPGATLIMKKGKFGSIRNNGRTILRGAQLCGMYNDAGTLESENATVNGNMLIKGGKTVIHKGTYNILSYFEIVNGTVFLKGGTYRTKKTAIYNCSGEVTITGGTYTGGSVGIRNNGKMTIEGGTITGSAYAISNGLGGEIFIKEGVITGDTYALCCGDKGSTDIIGGTFISKKAAPITIREVKNNGHVSIREAVLKTKPGYEHGAIWVPHKNKNIYISKANITYYGTSRLICE